MDNENLLQELADAKNRIRFLEEELTYRTQPNAAIFEKHRVYSLVFSYMEIFQPEAYVDVITVLKEKCKKEAEKRFNEMAKNENKNKYSNDYKVQASEMYSYALEPVENHEYDDKDKEMIKKLMNEYIEKGLIAKYFGKKNK